MILPSTELTPSQRAAIEAAAGRSLQAMENVVVLGSKAHVASDDLRQAATSQMRQRLNRMDPIERRMSIEDLAADLIDRSPDVLPA
jgi:hypothetical protein